MTKIKIIWGNWLKKIKKWGIVKMINYKDEINFLNNEIECLEQDIKSLRDLNLIYRNAKKELEKSKIKITKLEDEIKTSNKALKEHLKHINELNKVNDTLLDKTFKLDLENKSKQLQIEEYKAQIEDLKSDRYLIKKIPADRSKSKIKTKISKPLSARVTKYMRGEHE